jgi:chemotaxis protein histidine kinase CheA/ActR/RegA family two-component response regulator
MSDMLQAFQVGSGVPATPESGRNGNGGPAEPDTWRATSPQGYDLSTAGTAAMPTIPYGDPRGPQAPSQAPDWGASMGGASMGGASMAGQGHPTWEHPTMFVPPSSGGAGQQAPARTAAAAETNGLALSALDEVRVDADSVRRQVASLRDVVATLREAAQTMEDERTELRGFLDGSQDALTRLEEWAGQQMGLDLRNSPEHVRRYLPLSVIWVTTTRLKKLVALLHGSGRSLTATQEQIDETLGELRTALDSFGQLYTTVATIGGAPDQGFSATVAQVRYAPPTPSSAQEAVSPGTRAEIERQVREELRRELEDDVRDELAAEVRRDEEQRIRHELEIQVRRQLLSELAPGLGASAITVSGGPQPMARMPLADQAPRPIQVTTEQSPEAMEVFRDEAQEHLQTITTGISQLERVPGDADALRSIRRAMHTLKGAAGMMGFSIIQDLAHASEDLLDALNDGLVQFSPAVFSVIFDTSEVLDQLVTGRIASFDEQQRAAQPLIQRYAQLTGAPPASTSSPRGVSASPAAGLRATIERDEAAGEPAPTSPDLSVRLQLSKLDELVTIFGELLISRSVLEERLDRLNHLVGDTVRVSDRLRDVGGQLESSFEAATLPSGRSSVMLPNLNGPGQGGAWGGGAPGQMGQMGQMPFGGAARQPAHKGEFDALELDQYTEFHRLSRGLSEGVADVNTLSHELEVLIREIQTSFARESRQSSDFQDRLLKARLVPLQSLVTRLYRASRASALKEGKEVEFYIEGGNTEVDRKIFEDIEGPLLHIVRNAVNHGIEPPDVRERSGKPRTGHILVSAAYEGNQVAISVRDDGAGINPERIRQTAIARGLLDPNAQLSDREAINLIFRPGMTTADTVTEESGRGVGLDVVRDAVSRLRGSVEVDSTPGQGSTFTLKFPISLQIARAVLVRTGQQTYAVPMAVVSQIGRLDYYSRVPGAAAQLEVRGERYPVVHLAHYLNVPPGPIDDRTAVLLINTGRHRVAMLVDDVLSQQEIVSKPLGPHLVDVPGISGATVLGNGQVVLILELLELLSQPPSGTITLPEPGRRVAHEQLPTAPLTGSIPGDPASWGRAAPSAAPSASGQGFVLTPRGGTGVAQSHVVVPPSAQQSYLLVVDDSPSVRRVVSNMLKAHGWNVQAARDGIEALEVIARERPAAVLLDIEMPRMDGYELMATIRSQEQYRTLPLLVLTSRAATKHQQRAVQLGADAYIIKPYQDEDLLNQISALVQARA